MMILWPIHPTALRSWVRIVSSSSLLVAAACQRATETLPIAIH